MFRLPASVTRQVDCTCPCLRPDAGTPVPGKTNLFPTPDFRLTFSSGNWKFYTHCTLSPEDCCIACPTPWWATDRPGQNPHLTPLFAPGTNNFAMPPSIRQPVGTSPTFPTDRLVQAAQKHFLNFGFWVYQLPWPPVQDPGTRRRAPAGVFLGKALLSGEHASANNACLGGGLHSVCSVVSRRQACLHAFFRDSWPSKDISEQHGTAPQICLYDFIDFTVFPTFPYPPSHEGRRGTHGPHTSITTNAGMFMQAHAFLWFHYNQDSPSPSCRLSWLKTLLSIASETHLPEPSPHSMLFVYLSQASVGFRTDLAVLL